ncbi:MAG: spore coat associated protein CotJA [Clostridia bacterium]|nr:spore coat associated protein CotJA [Clostridia bacterium]
MPDARSDKNGNQTGWGLYEYPLAMVYSPYQIFREIYTPDVALSRGTLFSELDLPFEGYKGKGGC